MKSTILGFIVWTLYQALSLTWKITRVEPPLFTERIKKKLPLVLTHWHGDDLYLVGTGRRYRVVALVSQSKDGEIMNTFFKLGGGLTARGSSSKGGALGLRQLFNLSKEKKRNPSFAVDGPKGPYHEVKPGVFQFMKLSHANNAPLFAAGVASDRYWQFNKAWNKATLPKPFARVVVVWEEVNIEINKESDPRSPILAQILKNALYQSQSRAQKILSSV